MKKHARIFTAYKNDLAEKDGENGTAKEFPPMKKMQRYQMKFSHFLIPQLF